MKRFRTVFAGTAMSILLCGAAHAAAPVAPAPVPVELGEPVTPVSIDVDLRTLPVTPAWRAGMAIKEAHKRQFFPPDRLDTAAPDWLQAAPDTLPELQKMWDDDAPANRAAAQTRVSINNGSTGVSPGDPVVDVSANYILYGVNGSSGTNFTVYDKSGTKLAGPTTFASLAPSGDGCRTSVSDPIVLFDRLANRWFLLEMGGTSSAPKMCIYISKTENPVSGGWWFYGFSTPTQNDYPHCGVWTNAYVCTDNEGQANVTAYAYDRANMLNGATARPQQRFVSVPKLAGYGFQALTPATFMGDSAHAPAAGTQQILARHNDDEAHAGTSADTSRDFIDLYSINVDWNTPANSAVTALPRIAITEFNSWFVNYSTFATVPQPGSTSKLDPIREVILNSLVYRNLGSYESIVGQFSTNMNSARSGSTVNAGIRWFELRRTGGGSWTLQQEGTFGPGDTATNHFDGSIATDNKGNIGLGYNVTKTSSPTIYATLGYTGRKASDPSGVMTLGENTVAAGSAAETSGRWGDYYQMAVDPTDDCTFWMVGMYRPSGSWNTRIQDFKFNDCGAAPSTWSVSGTVTTSAGVGISGVTVGTGASSTTTNSSGAYTLGGLANGSYTLTPSLSGYTFSPASRSVTVSGANVSGADFTGTPPATNVPPVANFSFTTSGLTANFIDSSTDSDGSITARSWNFGDGTSSTATSPSHTYGAAGAYSVALTVTDNGGLTNTKTQSVTVSGGGGGNVLQNGVAATGLTASTGNSVTYTLSVPAGATNLKFVTSGGSGDGDLYVKFGSAPTTSSYDCRSWNSGNSETCTITTAQAGTYYVMVYAYSTFSGLSLTGSYSAGGGGGTTLTNGVPVTGLAAASGSWTPTYTLVVPSGATNLSFAISGGTGDADLYVRLGGAPSTTSYTCRPYLSGNSETCSWTAPTAGTYYVAVRAYSTFSGVTLTPNYTP
ncbi:pre-peptidase C-terminal domain-containing protein [Dokdonella sp.]|uniref:pre-peptidase C-terminal domain-containing protein n=1 Tax=Dokdonella sp. TaxID=2291710 RepID=UPI0025BFDCB0|nr:pre-peptidase C-terminal domain-containing protein [Dokdonella sp.]